MQLCLRALLICVLVSATVLYLQRPIAAALLPFFDVAICALQSDFSPALSVTQSGGEWTIRMTPFLLHAVPLTHRISLRPHVSLAPFHVSIDHALVPLVLLVTAASSWPFSGYREVVARIALTLAALMPVLVLTTPLLLIGRLQMWLVNLKQQHGASLPEPALATATIFMESGGRWLLPLVLAAACVAGSRWFSDKMVVAPSRSRHFEGAV